MNEQASGVMADAAKTLLAMARDHKKASRHHRDMAKKCMRDFSEIKRRLADIGIKLEIA